MTVIARLYIPEANGTDLDISIDWIGDDEALLAIEDDSELDVEVEHGPDSYSWSNFK